MFNDIIMLSHFTKNGDNQLQTAPFCSAWPLYSFIKKYVAQHDVGRTKFTRVGTRPGARRRLWETLLLGLCLLPNSSTPHMDPPAATPSLVGKNRRRDLHHHGCLTHQQANATTTWPTFSRKHCDRLPVWITPWFLVTYIWALAFFILLHQNMGWFAGRNTCCHCQLLLRLDCSYSEHLLWQDATQIIKLCWEPQKSTRGLVSSSRLVEYTVGWWGLAFPTFWRIVHEFIRL